jgi:serine protease AprX
MRKTVTLLLLALCFSATFAQTKELRHVIVVMEKQYDNVELSRKTQFMNKAQRREFVINDHKAFCEASQAEVLGFVGTLGNEVQSVKPFWAFNGFACMATDEAIQQLEARRDVAYIYHDKRRLMLPEMGEAKPVDSKDIAWHVDKVNAPAVWNYNGSTGYNGSGVIVAVVDSGVDYSHVDIAGSMWDGGSEYPHHGFDVCNNDNDPMDDYCHGTHVAGIIAGQGNAGTQTGIAPGAKIMAIKVLDDTGYGSDADLISGVHFAMNHGADIINLSLGDPEMGPSAVYRNLFNTVKDAGMIASVAAGNVGDTQYSYPVPFNVECPGNCPPPWLHPDQKNLISGGTSGVICVGATDSNDAHCSFSSVGPVTWADGPNVGDYNDYPYQNGDASQPGLIRPDISAPGANVTSLNYQTGSGYVAYDGTSMATPCVSAVLALLLQADPELTPAELDSIIELTAAPAGNVVKNNITGSGRIDALAAINALYHHGPTNLTANLDGDYVDLHWNTATNASYYEVYRDGLRIANNVTTTTYTDHLTYAGSYTYYIKAHLNNDMTTLPSNYVFVERLVDVQAEVINGVRVALSWDMPNGVFDGFESGDLYQNMWINDGTNPWEVTTQGPNSGIYCVRSTNKTMFSTSKLTLGVNVPVTCVVSYWAKVDCFPLNGGGFFIDNVQHGETLKDKVPWTKFSVTLSPGNHLLEWKYGNQLTEGDYENAFYVDDITVGNAYEVYRAHCDGSNVTLIASEIVNAEYVDNDWVSLPIGQYKYGVSIDGGNTIHWSDCIDKATVGVEETTEVNNIKHLTIVNTLGQVVYDAETSTDNSASILEQCSNGVYIVNILTDKGLVTKKVCR